MTDLAPLLLADKGQAATSILLVDKNGLEAWLKKQPERVRQAANAQGFKAEANQLAIIPGDKADWSAWWGCRIRKRLGLVSRQGSGIPSGGQLPPCWRLSRFGSSGLAAGPISVRPLQGKPTAKGPRILLTDEPARIAETVLIAEATSLVRDLVNLPAGDLGPAELQQAVEAIASDGAAISVTSGAKLDSGYR
jgi:leucyl aminopeptidase